MISCYIDTDDPLFVIAKFSAQSFWFLGGMQLNYSMAFSFMKQLFALESILDSWRVILAYYESQTLKDYIPTSDAFIKRKTSPDHNYIELQPTNVYEDLARSYLVVLMVFVTQVLLIAFVVVDIYTSFFSHARRLEPVDSLLYEFPGQRCGLSHSRPRASDPSGGAEHVSHGTSNLEEQEIRQEIVMLSLRLCFWLIIATPHLFRRWYFVRSA